jgi:glutaredoxin-related protein
LFADQGIRHCANTYTDVNTKVIVYSVKPPIAGCHLYASMKQRGQLHNYVYAIQVANYDGSWRIQTNDELDNLIKGRNIVNFIKAQRISWLGHISRMEAGRTVTLYIYIYIHTHTVGNKLSDMVCLLPPALSRV